MMLVTAQADDSASTEAKEKKFEAKCPVSGAKAKEDQTAAYKEAKVYFCCGKCKAAFEKDSKQHAVKANAQLVSTGQYVQKKCPLTGGPMKKKLKVAGVDIQVCCGNCKKKALEAEDADALAMIFGEKSFKKGFAKKKAKKAADKKEG
jgi:hypothetical protein